MLGDRAENVCAKTIGISFRVNRWPGLATKEEEVEKCQVPMNHNIRFFYNTPAVCVLLVKNRFQGDVLCCCIHTNPLPEPFPLQSKKWWYGGGERG